MVFLHPNRTFINPLRHPEVPHFQAESTVQGQDPAWSVNFHFYGPPNEIKRSELQINPLQGSDIELSEEGTIKVQMKPNRWH